MSDSYVKDIVYDLINSKLRIKELEDKLNGLESENAKLVISNNELKEEVNKWKSHITSYIDDYRDLYIKSKESIEVVEEIPLTNEAIIPEVKQIDNKQGDVKHVDIKENIEKKKKARSEYMKEYMKEYQRNKRGKQKEDVKQIVINKK